MVEEDFRGETHEKAVMINLDLTDRKILYILCANARISNTTIAKVLKLSREVVSYRIKAMEKANFLVGYLTLVNPRKLGFEEIIIYFKLKSLKQEN